MSFYSYQESIKLSEHEYNFYALIMAAMRKADSINIIKLKRKWPDTWKELQRRDNAPGGLLPEEKE